MSGARPPIEVLEERLLVVRERYGDDRPLPPIVTLWAPVPELPIARVAPRRVVGGRCSDDDPCRACGTLSWARTPGKSGRRCQECDRRRARGAQRRKT